MKLMTFCAVALLAGCSSLMNGANQQQPVLLKDAKSNTWFTTCSGAVEDWSSCVNKALKKCPKGYETLDKIETAASGGRRELTFTCK